MAETKSSRPKLSLLSADDSSARNDEDTQIGARVRALRKSKSWSLAKLSDASDVPQSTLSKFETGSLSLPLDRIFRITDALDVAVTELFDESGTATGAAGRRSISRANEGRHQSTATYNRRWMFPDLLQKRMYPVAQEVLAHNLDEFGPLSRHEGEEFALVLEGRVKVVTDIYEPVTLETGDGIYIDSRMAHAYLKASEAKAVILVVSTSVFEPADGGKMQPEE